MMKQKVNTSMKNSGFTLVEILVVFTLLAVIGSTVPITLNVQTQFNKSKDARVKSELAVLKNIIEDFHSDNERYPRPDEVCYNASGSNPCSICGHQGTPTAIQGYTTKLACSPYFPSSNYTYVVNDPTLPLSFQLYAVLAVTSDPVIEDVGCASGCGPMGQYNYGISSSDTGL